MKAFLSLAFMLILGACTCNHAVDFDDRDELFAQVASPSVLVQRTTDEGTGSGIVVFQNSEYAYVLTAAHVVVDELNLPRPVMLSRLRPDRTPIPGEVIRLDVKHDLALIQTASAWPAVAVVVNKSDLDNVGWGSRVAIFGHPLGTTEGMLTDGRITSTDYHGKLRYSASTFYGNSGGGVFVKTAGRWKLVSVVQLLALWNSPEGFRAPYPQFGMGVHPYDLLNFLKEAP